MKTLVISDEIKARAPGLHVLQIEADIENPATPDALWDELETLAADVRARYAMEMVNKRPAIAATPLVPVHPCTGLPHQGAPFLRIILALCYA